MEAHNVFDCLRLLIPPAREEGNLNITEGPGIIQLQLLHHCVQNVLHCSIALETLVGYEGGEGGGRGADRNKRTTPNGDFMT